jgi:hypothetical protein
MKALDNFYDQQNEPLKSCLFALKEIILKQDKEVTNELKYGMPFFCYQGRMFCYLWVHKKEGLPYVGIVEGGHFDHPLLIQEKRSRMKILFVDPEKDLLVELLEEILQKALDLYRNGTVKIKR